MRCSACKKRITNICFIVPATFGRFHLCSYMCLARLAIRRRKGAQELLLANLQIP